MTTPAHNEAVGSGGRSTTSSISARTPTLTHLTPRPFLDPIRLVKRHSSIHWKRKLFHLTAIGTVGVTYALAGISASHALGILGMITVVFVGLDLLRFIIPSLNNKVRRELGMLMRDYELDGISGSSWFLFSALLSIALFPKLAAALGILYLAVGDPIASTVGMKWGRHRLPGGGKSLEGSAALVAVCTLSGCGLLALIGGFSFAHCLLIAFGAALTAAVAEWLPLKRIDDNFVVPLLTGAVATFLLQLF